MQEWITRHSFSLFFLFWLLVFFPSWYALSYTKVRELQQMIFRPREVQLQVLHPAGEMAQLLELQKVLREQFVGQNVAVLGTEQNDQAPLATDLSVQRAVLYPVPVVSANEIEEQEVLVVLTFQPESSNCREGSGVPERYEGEVLCWPISQR